MAVAQRPFLQRLLLLLSLLAPLAARAQATDRPPPPLGAPPPSLPSVVDLPPPLPAVPTDELLPLDLPALPDVDIAGKKLCVWPFKNEFTSAEAQSLDVQSIFLDVAKESKSLSDAVLFLDPVQACELDDTACFIKLGNALQCGTMLVGSSTKANGLVLHTRWISAEKNEVVSKSDSVVESDNVDHIQAWAEGQACSALKVDCKSTLVVDADRKDMALVLDKHTLKRSDGTQLKVSVKPGLHSFRVLIDERTSLERRVPLRRNKTTTVFARQTCEGGLYVYERHQLQGGVARQSCEYSTGLKPTKVAAIVTAGVGVLALGIGAYEGLHGKSLQNQANDGYKSRGAYSQADVGNLNSASSAMKTGNVLMAVGAGLIVAAAVLTFAF